MIVFALVLHKALSLSRGITTLFAGGLLTIAIGAGAILAWTVAKDCRAIRGFFLPSLRSTDVNSLLVNYKGHIILSQMTHGIDQKRAMLLL